jgi:hypothetical protein
LYVAKVEASSVVGVPSRAVLAFVATVYASANNFVVPMGAVVFALAVMAAFLAVVAAVAAVYAAVSAVVAVTLAASAVAF